jgi:hypothetical protein
MQDPRAFLYEGSYYSFYWTADTGSKPCDPTRPQKMCSVGLSKSDSPLTQGSWKVIVRLPWYRECSQTQFLLYYAQSCLCLILLRIVHTCGAGHIEGATTHCRQCVLHHEAARSKKLLSVGIWSKRTLLARAWHILHDRYRLRQLHTSSMEGGARRILTSRQPVDGIFAPRRKLQRAWTGSERKARRFVERPLATLLRLTHLWVWLESEALSSMWGPCWQLHWKLHCRLGGAERKRSNRDPSAVEWKTTVDEPCSRL